MEAEEKAKAGEVLAKHLYRQAQPMLGTPPWASASDEDKEQSLTQAFYLTLPFVIELLAQAGYESFSQVTKSELEEILYQGDLAFVGEARAIAQGWASSYRKDARSLAQDFAQEGMLA